MGVVVATDGTRLPLDNLQQTLNYTSGVITSISVVYNGITFLQTFTRTGNVITSISRWVPQ